MKTRNCFVSNSSSSSFIVGFEKDQLPKNAEEMRKLLYGNKKQFKAYDWHKSYTTQELANQVWEDFEKQEPATIKEIRKTMSSGWCFDLEVDDFKTEDGAIDWDAFDKESEILSNEEAEKIIKENPDLVFYTFSYGDESGEFFCNLEHGGTFDNLFNVRISHH